jgi:hypothetical protein
MLACAPRNREAATMFMALVICLVFFTAPIFNWISFKVAIAVNRKTVIGYWLLVIRYSIAAAGAVNN